MPPKPGMIPRLISGCPNEAENAARRTSQAIASSQPPPSAMPLTAAIVIVRDVSKRAEQRVRAVEQLPPGGLVELA